MGGRIQIDVDMSQLENDINYLKTHMTPQRFAAAMYGVFRATGRHAATIMKKDLPHMYHVTASEVGAAVKQPNMNISGTNVSCSIPIRGVRKTIGKGFAASGSARGWQSVRKKYRVTAKIVKGQVSKLPTNMPKYGGMPPFRNIPSKLGIAAFTRGGRNRFPIKAVVGIAVPQMPMNRSADEVENDLLDYAEERLRHRIEALLSGGR